MKPLASLSLDLDNQWSYMKTHGDQGWRDYPSYLDLVVPRVLELLATRGLEITFFVVGQDAALDRNHDALRSIAENGHEIGNHSFAHEPWLHRYSPRQIEDDICRSEEEIQRATGQRPRGFRGPGFSLTPAVLETLVKRSYRYDATTFPTFIGPLARAYYMRTAMLDRAQLRERGLLFGTLADGLRPITPYRWRVQDRNLVEVPVTTMPFFRVPIHVSYLLYLAGFSRAVARAYFRLALTLCQLARVAPSLLLHPLDFLGKNDTRALDFFPAMGMTGEVKTALVGELLELLTERFEVLSLIEYVERAAAAGTLPVRRLQAVGGPSPA